jgi:uncharacterized protein YdhG (YjbR/CyaY superfamily)
MIKRVPAKSVDAYLKKLPSDQRAALEKIRAVIKAAAPEAEELISYHIPMYKYFGHLVCFAAYEGHCSFYVVNKKILTDFAKELSAYKVSGTTVHFSPTDPLPLSLVKKIVRRRMKENEGKRGG